MKIHIDCTVSKFAKITLFDGKKAVDYSEGTDALVLLTQLLSKHNLKIEDIEEVTSDKGPGSFVGTRVGASIANILNWSKGKKKLIVPIYNKAT